MSFDVVGFVSKASEKCGFVRERHDDRKLPTDPKNICVVPFFGDLRSLFILSSLLLNRFREEDRASKYFILCSWPGFEVLFPYVDEYWGIADQSICQKFYASASQFRNKNQFASVYYRNLNTYFFEDVVIPADQFCKYYDGGITSEFWNKYRHIKRTLPSVPSSTQLGKDLNREMATRGGFKVFVYPATHITSWSQQHGPNDTRLIQITKDFWVELLRRMVRERFVPVVYKSWLTHDVSGDLTDKCMYVTEIDFGKVLSIMRAAGCVLDVFTGISRLALAARCPFVSVDERSRFVALKEYEIDDLCCPTLSKQYIFSFPTIIESGSVEGWDTNILNSIVARLHSFLPGLDRDEWPPTGEVTSVVPYETVRRKKLRKIGTKLLKVSKD